MCFYFTLWHYRIHCVIMMIKILMVTGWLWLCWWWCYNDLDDGGGDLDDDDNVDDDDDYGTDICKSCHAVLGNIAEAEAVFRVWYIFAATLANLVVGFMVLYKFYRIIFHQYISWYADVFRRLFIYVQELMNNSELISRIATALIKGDMYERVSCWFLLTHISF